MPSSRARLVVKTAFYTLLAAGVLGAVTGFTVLRAGWYNVGATSPHLEPVYRTLEAGMRYSVRRHAKDIVAPKLGEEGQVLRGAALYREHCAQCHGGPGTAPARHGMSMQPAPGPLVDATQRWKPRELYWITRHGIKMAGMPAWEFYVNEPDTWALVAFLTALPGLDAQAYRGMTGTPPPAAPPDMLAPARRPAVGDIARGKLALTQYACQACHLIPGVTGSEVYVGRPLDHLAKRRLIAGIPNTPENLVRWIRHPQSVDPDAAMPSMGVTYQDALDMSVYLLQP